MKNLIYTLMAFALFSCMACQNKKAETIDNDEEIEISDSTYYGICGKGTMMHSLELITATNDTIVFAIDDESEYPTEMAGGLLSGDRMAVTGRLVEGGMTASRIINLTSLLGHWTSLDRKFEICEDGTVKSDIKAESNPWTQWRILNGQLVLSADTFDVRQIDADSLYIENDRGIYTFARIKALAPTK